jgi:uncharacterized membrane protein YsdA (DUF1294 family)
MTSKSKPVAWPDKTRPGASLTWGLLLAWGALTGWGSWTQRLPLAVTACLMGLSLLTFLVYWRDKRAAQKGRWRTAEDTLHLLSLLGGWPGACLAQRVLRHKSHKASFRATYWATVAAHCTLVLGWLFWLQPLML